MQKNLVVAVFFVGVFEREAAASGLLNGFMKQGLQFLWLMSTFAQPLEEGFH